MRKVFINLLVLLGLVLFSGCTSNQHTTANLGQIMQVKQGTIHSVKRITILKCNTQSTALGAIVGTVAGAVLGSHIGGGSATIVTSTIGGVLGNSLGADMGTSYDKTYGQEMIIILKDGSFMATILDIDKLSIVLNKGDKVNVLFSGRYVYKVIPVKD